MRRLRFWFWHLCAISECIYRFGVDEEIGDDEWAWYQAFMVRHVGPDWRKAGGWR
jgi:hypothetical protein